MDHRPEPRPFSVGWKAGIALARPNPQIVPYPEANFNFYFMVPTLFFLPLHMHRNWTFTKRKGTNKDQEFRMAKENIYSSKYPSTVVPSNESFWEFLQRLNIDDTLPDKVILQEHERPERFLTYESAPKVAGLGAAALRKLLGLSPGDTIMIIGKNSLDWLQVEFAALWAGVTSA